MTVCRIDSSIPFDSNIYLVTGRSGILVDCGTGLDSDNVIEGIWNALDGLRLSCVLLTHCHADHSGGLSSIVREFGCPAYMGTLDLGPYSSNDRDVLFSRQLGVEVDPVGCKALSEGEVFDIGDHRLRAISTPGHTAGGLCFYDEVTRSLFSGDTVFARGYGRTDLPGGSTSKLAESLSKLRNVNIGMMYPGHGPASPDGNESVREAVKMMEGW
ncbi:MBL fold metallo-hydrolase [Methanomethylophilus alvi]|uniref:MBL fold metallo-hydrolase n=1 Tax=Methanomethylophilus alvi TaxID=1291540 RepID=UPI0037DDB20E